MTQITLTRHYSGFVNVADKWSIGNNETSDSAVYVATLPEGYTIGKTGIMDEDIIFDPMGHGCQIVHHTSGNPQLISVSGPIKAQPVLQID